MLAAFWQHPDSALLARLAPSLSASAVPALLSTHAVLLFQQRRLALRRQCCDGLCVVPFSHGGSRGWLSDRGVTCGVRGGGRGWSARVRRNQLRCSVTLRAAQRERGGRAAAAAASGRAPCCWSEASGGASIAPAEWKQGTHDAGH